MYTELVFENYEKYLDRNKHELATPNDAIVMLTSDGSFKGYMEQLTEGLDDVTTKAVMVVAQREREYLLEEATQIGPDTGVIGYAVTYFPILTDIYSEPILAQVATLYPTPVSIVTIPKVELEASVKNSDGSTVTYSLPRATHQVRGAIETIDIAPNDNVNLFDSSSAGLVNIDNARVNKRYFIIDRVTIQDDSVVTNTFVAQNLNIFVRPDARGQVKTEFNFIDDAGANCAAKMIGNINWDSGVITYSVTIDGGTVGATYQTTSAQSKVMFSATTGDIGRVKVQMKISGWDINVDVRDDFEIDLQSEMIQDYRDIYNIDLIRSMSEAIKRQIMFNKDFDLSYFLQAAEPEMLLNGSKANVDLNQFAVGGGDYHPANVLDVLRGIVPYINTVTRVIERNYRAAPQFLVAGLQTASMLDSLQEYVVSMPKSSNGEVGFAASNMAFRKQKIIACHAIPDNKIYTIYKAPSSDKSRTAIVDIVYKPLYIIPEVTNAMKKTYVRSRTAMEITAISSLGCIEVANLNDYIGV